MSESTKNRRQFLGIAGATIAGVVIAHTAFQFPLAEAKSRATAQENSLEAWLLSTGQEELEPQLLMSVQQQIH